MYIIFSYYSMPIEAVDALLHKCFKDLYLFFKASLKPMGFFTLSTAEGWVYFIADIKESDGVATLLQC